MDKHLEQIEEKLSALYAEAAKDMQDKLSDFMEGYEKQKANLEAQVVAGKMTQEEYSQWLNRHIVQSNEYKSTIDSLTTMAVNADVAAMAYVDGNMPMVIAQSYNFTEALGFEAAQKAGLTQGTFQVYNARSVEKIIKENPNLLKEVDMDEDEKWNREKLNREISQGIIQGESIDKVADRLQRVVNMDANAATRNARTMMTAAENMGRAEAADDLKTQGIPIEEVWSATYDSRTRETHLELDGTIRDEHGYFGVGILNKPLRFPADPDGDPEEIYNCRCRLNIQLKGIDHSNDRELYEQFMKENYSDDWKNLQSNEHYQEMEKQREAALERKEALLDPDPKESQEKPSDFVASRGADVPSEMEAKANEAQDLSYKEMRDIFIDNPDSYIYDPRYQAMSEERSDLLSKDNALREEREKLSEELKNESQVKPKSEWTEDERFYYEIIGDKPMEYTDRGLEIEDRLRDVRSEERDVESKISDINDRLSITDRFNYAKELDEWEKSIDQYHYEKGDADKDYEGISTTMGIKEFDDDLKKGIGFIAEMSPDEYLDRIAFEIFHTTKERAIVCDYSNVKEYAKMMANGVKFDMGYLNYEGDRGQEGRHRAMAAKLLGIEKIPVYIRGRRG